MRATIALITCLTFIPAAACGGGSGSGVDETLSVSALSAEDGAAICEHTADSMTELGNFGCLIGAVFAGMAGEAECQSAWDACIAAGGAVDQAGLDEAKAACGSADLDLTEYFGEDCTGTVAQHDACLQATIDAANSAVDNFSCSAESDDGDADEPAACVTWREKGCNPPLDGGSTESTESAAGGEGSSPDETGTGGEDHDHDDHDDEDHADEDHADEDHADEDHADEDHADEGAE